MTVDKSFESLEKFSNLADCRENSAEYSRTNFVKPKEQDYQNFLPLVPSLPAMRLP